MGRPRKNPKPAAKNKPASQPKNQQAKAEKPLPPPVDVPLTSAQPNEPSSSLFGLDSVFRNQQNPIPFSAGSDGFSTPISEPEPGAPLDADGQRLLARVPERIAGAGPEDEPLQPTADSGADDPIAALMEQVAFEEQDVKDTLCEFFDWLSVKFENDNWRLTDRQARMLGKPTAQLANSLWIKLQNLLPEIIARWCAETPGAMAFISACGLVIVPKVMNQIKVSRERKMKKRVREMPSRPASVGVSFDQSVPAMGGGR